MDFGYGVCFVIPACLLKGASNSAKNLAYDLDQAYLERNNEVQNWFDIGGIDDIEAVPGDNLFAGDSRFYGLGIIAPEGLWISDEFITDKDSITQALLGIQPD